MHSTAAIPDPLHASFRLKAPELCAIAPPRAANGVCAQGKNKGLLWPMTQEGVRLERRHRIAKMLNALLDIVRASQALPPVLAYIVAQTEPLLAATACALYRLADDHDSLELQSSWGLPTSFATLAQLSLAGKPAIQEALTANRPLIIPTLVRDPLDLDVASPACRQMLFASGAYTTLIVPLTVDKERYGALLLYFVDPVEFTEADLTLAMAFGRKAACGIESALAWQAADQATLVAPEKRSHVQVKNEAINERKNLLSCPSRG